jgi:CBS domain-containing protein
LLSAKNEKEHAMRAIDMSPPMLATIDESAPLIDAARMMREKGVGDIIIVRMVDREARPVGVVTDRDIVVHAIACDLKPDELTVADLCTREPVTVDAEADLAEITTAMKEHGVRRLLVKRDCEIAGVVTLDNVIDAMAEMMNDLSEMMTRQLDYETAHLVSEDDAA